MSRRKKLRADYYQPPPEELIGCAPEQALCYDFISDALHHGWEVLPEYPDSRFDLFLVAGEGCSTAGVTPGTQVGVQAKMQLNVELLGQLLTATRHKHYDGPDYVVGLVPGRPHTENEYALAETLERLNIGLFYMYQDFSGHDSQWTRRRDNLSTLLSFGAKQFKNRMKLPEVRVWTEPGVRSPQAITTWKMRAVKFILALEKAKGFTNKEFREHRMHVQTWLNAGWVVNSGEKRGRASVYIMNPNTTERPDLKNPDLRLKLEERAAQEEGSKAAETREA